MARPRAAGRRDGLERRGPGSLSPLGRKRGRAGTIGLAAGFLTWFLRGGALLTSLLSSMPLWARFDPLPVLASPGGQGVGLAGAWDEDEEEQDVARILDKVDSSQTRRARESLRQSGVANPAEELDERANRLPDGS